MAKNLRAKVPTSDSLVIHDINSAVTNQFVEEHAGQNVEIAASVRQISEKAETIITVLPEQHHVQNVLLAMLKPQTLLDIGPAKPRLFIDCSTIDPKSSRAASNAVRASGQGKFVDAPMSGGVVGAAAGTLTFMIGASNELVPPVTEILMKMGKRVLHMGEQGAGLKGKLANNYLLGLNNIATCEAMNMGTKWGLDPQKLAELINTSTGKCWPSEVNNPVPYVVRDSPASKGYEGGFGVSLMKKDLKLALQAAHEVGAASTMGYEALSVYDLVETDENCKGRDFSVVYRYLGGKE
ncbi:MAG: hypothetical protein M1821_000466 [Bathelium mastoideum]|nr:MAG: hypothetical protein M1821_000466 [Bathelium mastoideum]KAI9686281.1 MAG: hypothetical protein M1822_003937 [Bathelium mastoideum]